MEINTIILKGIFDMGSNINIISKDAWQRTAQWLMSVKRGVMMGDINEGGGGTYQDYWQAYHYNTATFRHVRICLLCCMSYLSSLKSMARN